MTYTQYKQIIEKLNAEYKRIDAELAEFKSANKKDLRRGNRYEHRLSLLEKILVAAVPAAAAVIFGLWIEDQPDRLINCIIFAVIAYCLFFAAVRIFSVALSFFSMRSGKYEKREKYIALINERIAIEKERKFYADKIVDIESFLECGNCEKCFKTYEYTPLTGEQKESCECSYTGEKTRERRKVCEHYEDVMPDFFAGDF